MNKNNAADIDKWRGYWKTKISKVGRNKVWIRGYPLEEITGNLSYIEAFFLIVKDRLPSDNEAKMFDVLLTAGLDHQFINSIMVAARVVASANPSLTAAIAVHALGQNNVIGVTMPSKCTSGETLCDVKSLCENLNIRLITILLDDIYESYLRSLKEHFPNSMVRQSIEANARLLDRSTILQLRHIFPNRFYPVQTVAPQGMDAEAQTWEDFSRRELHLTIGILRRGRG